MNCKPGDMAICIADVFGFIGTGEKAGESAWGRTAGRVVCVTVASDDIDDGLVWEIEPPIRVDITGFNWDGRGTLSVLPDSILIPLPPLSEDEHDQTEAGKPEKVLKVFNVEFYP